MNTLVRITCSSVPLQNSAKTLLGKINIQAVRTITSKLDDLPPKPKPWDYHNKKFNIMKHMFDKTTARFDENTKVIVVEGPIAAGKSKFAQEIAKSFGMQYYPEANLDMRYINEYGFDLRQLDSQLAPDCRSFDVMDFLKNPKHKLVARMQIEQYMIRLSQYIDALAHVFSTGQGVVLDRCVYSDFIFIEAMFSQKFISRPAYKKYYEFRESTLQELLKPHLIIYLDVPILTVMENIKKRNISYEKASPALTPMYLEVMERNYKQNYLKDMAEHAELLVYDWTVEGDMEVVLEDIEAIDFQRYDYQDPQLKDWMYDAEEDWAVLRYKYAERKERIMNFCNVPCFDVPELMVDAIEADDYYRIMREAPGQKYEKGYNAEMGDGGNLFKWAVPHRSTLPLRERR
ncbi:NADH dehydrogenase [ubiquinone] 1 alpha subcomplex subunit 10, mitochondrial isoform X2 [Anthonomus grandis grandis]|nr:NADH dehydrogenase [ubiquinone] 1 alpha subcomplex subunit 10, mitochondrial isoform X2 [Anthonomus grandis grandis]